MENNKSKDLGQVFTPDYVADLILDDIGYTHNHIIDKKIMEPSFGKGVFLLHILRRLILECETLNFSREDTIKQIQNNIYGIEIDEECYNETIERINGFLRGFGFQNIKLNLFLQDTLQWNKFGMFDYVVGNPPYIRIHNLDEKNRTAIKDFEFSKGMADLYIIFFEIGLRMLNGNGKLGYITPNSYLTNSSQKNFRKYLLEKNLLQIIENYGSWKVFENFDTYTCITVLNKNKDNTSFNYSSIEGIERKYITTYDNDCFKIGNEWTGDAWNLTSQENIDFLNSIKTRTQTISDYGTVQYGFATNKDNVYIVKDIQDTKKKSVKIFNGFEIESKLLKKIVKGSKYHGSGNYWILFPYKQNEKDGSISVIEEDEMKKKYPLAYSYFLAHKEELLKRDMDSNAKTWYQFARSQGLNNCFKKKIVINHILPDNSQQAEVYKLDEETLVYSGIYITTENDEKLNFIKDELQSSDFAKYAVLCGKDMSGGYKSFNTNIVKNYNVNSVKFDLNYTSDNINTLFLDRVKRSYSSYTESSRSSNKIKPIHSFIAEVLQYKLGEDYLIRSDGFRESKEQNVQGAYYDKNVDICVLKNNKVLGSIAIKFICGNYLQNSNNYFENMLGETANLRRNDEYYAQMIIIPEYMPYFKDSGALSKIEYITDHNMEKYIKLNQDSPNYPHCPDLLSTVIICLNNEAFLLNNIGNKIDKNDLSNSVLITYSNLNNSQNIISPKTREFITKHSNVSDFLEAVVNYIKAKSFGM